MNEHLEWMIKHIKTFSEVTGNDNGGIWSIKWADGSNDPMIYNNKNPELNFSVPNIMLAEYIASLHNAAKYLIKEVEFKGEKE